MGFNKYPYTDLHEMNLDWIIARTKELIAKWAETSAAWLTQQEAFESLKNFINTWFDNLDVQQEINNKIDDLVEDGTLSELIAPYVASGLPAVVADQISAVVAAQISAVVASQLPSEVASQLPAIAADAAAAEVGTWLSTHVDPDTGYVIDDSLTVQGAAADAKATGDEITDLKSALSEYTKTELDKQIFDYRSANIVKGVMAGASFEFTSVARSACIVLATINAESGKQYTFNFIMSDTYASLGIEKINMVASNELPVVGNHYLVDGSYNAVEKRAIVTTNANTTYLILYVIAPSGGSIDDVDFNYLLSKLVVRQGGYDNTKYYPYTLIDVQEDNLSQDLKNKINQSGDNNAYSQLITKTLYVGSNVLTDASASLGTGWSGTLTNGFTHTSGNTASLSFSIATDLNSEYLVTFNLSNTAEKAVKVKIGNSAEVDVYNGTQSVAVGFVADGGYLSIVPDTTWNGTITNLELRKIGETGTEVELTVNNVYTKADDKTITGFWNVGMGAENTQESNQNGSRNIAIGYASQNKLVSGTRNIGVGTFSMPFVKEGDRNIAIGADSLYSTHNYPNAKAYDNIAIGYRAMPDGTNLQYNIGIGTRALSEMKADGQSNIGIGEWAGVYAQSGVIAIGRNASTMSYTKPSNSVFVGRNTSIDNTGATSENPKSVTNCIAIGDSVTVKQSNEARFGNASNVIYLAGKKIVFNADHTVTWEDDV